MLPQLDDGETEAQKGKGFCTGESQCLPHLSPRNTALTSIKQLHKRTESGPTPKSRGDPSCSPEVCTPSPGLTQPRRRAGLGAGVLHASGVTWARSSPPPSALQAQSSRLRS